MELNLSQWERYLRLLLGFILLVYAFAGGPAWAFLGAFPLVTGAYGICPIFAMLKISTK